MRIRAPGNPLAHRRPWTPVVAAFYPSALFVQEDHYKKRLQIILICLLNTFSEFACVSGCCGVSWVNSLLIPTGLSQASKRGNVAGWLAGRWISDLPLLVLISLEDIPIFSFDPRPMMMHVVAGVDECGSGRTAEAIVEEC